MFLSVKRALGWACLITMTACPACAFTFSYGSLLNVVHVQVQDGMVVLPLTQQKYRNVKVLSRQVYQFIKQCGQDCRYPQDRDTFTISDFRQARNNEHMMIADIAINQDLIITFLVFKNKNGFSIKTPEVVQFKNEHLLREIKKALTEQAKQIL